MLDSGHIAFTTRLTRTIGPTANDAWDLLRVRDLEVDARGQIWVLEDTDQSIRLFSADGKYIRKLGGKGSGPGEFEHFYWIHLLGDTVWVADTRNLRLTSYSVATGQALRNTRPGGMSGMIQGVSPTGVFNLIIDANATPKPGKPTSGLFVHESNMTKQRRSLATYAQKRTALSVSTYYPDETPIPPKGSLAGRLFAPQPFDDVLLYKIGAGGRSIVFLERDVPGVASANPLTWSKARTPLRIVEIGLNGDTILDRRYGTPSIPITAAQVTAVVDSISRSPGFISGRNMRASIPDIRDSLYVPKVWPPATELFVGADDTIWLRQPQPPGKSSHFWRIGRDGKILPSVMVPGGFRIVRVSVNRIWGVNADGEQGATVQVHDVVPLKSGRSNSLQRRRAPSPTHETAIKISDPLKALRDQDL
ncbi:MAG: 6-bladed beta-propeller [Gemmatimonadaceae bacterium]